MRRQMHTRRCAQRGISTAAQLHDGWAVCSLSPPLVRKAASVHAQNRDTATAHLQLCTCAQMHTCARSPKASLVVTLAVADKFAQHHTSATAHEAVCTTRGLHTEWGAQHAMCTRAPGGQCLASQGKVNVGRRARTRQSRAGSYARVHNAARRYVHILASARLDNCAAAWQNNATMPQHGACHYRMIHT